MSLHQAYVKVLKRVYTSICLSIATGLSLFILDAYAVELAPVTMQALVIGNSNYINKPLINPVQDAQLIADTLKEVGFNVTLVADLDRKAFFTKVREFYNGLPKGSVALVYYAGHGVQISGANYLIPIDMRLTSERGVEVNAYPLKAMLDSLHHANSVVNIVILDACRNNPFQPSNPSKFRSLENIGLAKVNTPKGSIIAYSTAPGQLAEDGLGNKHSLYTAMLSDEIKKPGVTIETVLKKVADAVRKKTFDDQQPWYESSLVDDFYFVPPDGVQMVSPKTAKLHAQDQHIQASRGVKLQDKQASPSWYAQLSESELSQLDAEIQQRVKHLSEDEIPLLLSRANKGNLVAQTTLGIAYRDGLKKIVDVDTGKVFRTNSSNKKSIHMLTKAAESGFPIAQTELGEMLYLGKFIEKDVIAARKWLELASHSNFKRAQIDLLQLNFMSNPGDPRSLNLF
ncbi:MAG: caspase family protein [Methylophilus sp.]|uniref:caspase family protein n=1 Tax=Methylophilus sp. TaxID=29541 RepID=UPI003FA1745E